MKTALHRNEDGYEIISGFRDGTIDPVETAKIIQPRLLALPEVAQLDDLKRRATAQAELARNAYAVAETELKAGRKAQADAATADYQAALSRIPLLEEEARPIAEAFEAARIRLFETCAVYFTPGPGEHVLSDAQFAELSAKYEALGEHRRLCLDGSVIADFRGVRYWTKAGTWKPETITKLGASIPAGAVPDSALSEAQRLEIAAEAETARIAALSAPEKTAELAARLEVVAREAAAKKSMAEITGDAFDARAWYAAEKARLEVLYL